MSISNKHSIVIISAQPPGYGGQAIYAFELYRKLSARYRVNALFILSDNKYANNFSLPVEDGLAYRSLKLSKNVHLDWFLQGSLKLLRKKIRPLWRRAFNEILYYKILWFIRQIKQQKEPPDLLICNVRDYFPVSKRLAKKFKLLHIIGGNAHLAELAEKKVDAQTAFESGIQNYRPLYLNKGKAVDNMHFLFNSKLTHDSYTRLESFHVANAYVSCVNFLPCENTFSPMPFEKRPYAIGFFASNLNRKIKNCALAIEVMKKFPDFNHIITGLYHEQYDPRLPFIHAKNLQTHDQLMQILANVKLVIIPSYFDSSPAIMGEALAMGANVLISRNVGWNEIFPKTSVVKNFYDFDEWMFKTEHLLKENVDYSEVLEVLKQGEKNIKNIIEGVLSN